MSFRCGRCHALWSRRGEYSGGYAWLRSRGGMPRCGPTSVSVPPRSRAIPRRSARSWETFMDACRKTRGPPSYAGAQTRQARIPTLDAILLSRVQPVRQRIDIERDIMSHFARTRAKAGSLFDLKGFWRLTIPRYLLRDDDFDAAMLGLIELGWVEAADRGHRLTSKGENSRSNTC